MGYPLSNDNDFPLIPTKKTTVSDADFPLLKPTTPSAPKLSDYINNVSKQQQVNQTVSDKDLMNLKVGGYKPTPTTEQKQVTQYGTQLISSGIEKRKENINEGIKNTLQRKYELSNQKVSTNSPQYQNDVKDLQSKLDNGDVQVTQARDGQYYLVPTSGFWESAGNAIINSLKQPVQSFKVNSISDPKDFANFADQYAREQPYLPEKVPSPFLGSLGEAVGGVPKIAGEMSLNELYPGAGTTLTTIEAYHNSLADQRLNLYQMNLKQLTDNGVPFEKARLQAAQKAMQDAPLSAIPDAASMYALSEAGFKNLKPAEQSALETSANTFKNTLIKSTKDVGKMAAIFGTSEATKSGVEKLQGYDISTQDILDNFGKGALQGATMEAMFKIYPLIKSMPGSVKAAWKNYMSNVPREILNDQAATMGKDGAQMLSDIESYNAAKDKVKDLVPEEHLPQFAGLTEKQDKLKSDVKDLEKSKETVPTPFHADIDKQIQNKQSEIGAIDKQIADMKKTDNPLDKEQDYLIPPNLPKEGELTPDEEKAQTSKEPIQETMGGSEPSTEDTKGSVGEKKEEINLNLVNKNSNELNDLVQEAKNRLSDKEEALGIGKEWKRKYAFASDEEKKKMEDALTEEQKSVRYGKGISQIDNPELINNIRGKVIQVETTENAQELVPIVAKAITDIGNKRADVEEIAILNAAKRKIQELGIDSKEFQDQVFFKLRTNLGDEVAKSILENYFNKSKSSTEVNKGTGIEDTQQKQEQISAGKVEPEKIGNADISEHGEDTKTQQQVENGIKPTKLTDEGKTEAEDLGKYIADNNQDKIVSSEVERAKQTADIASKKATEITGKEIPVETNKVLNTWNIGDFEGKPEGSFDESEWANKPTKKPQGGESFNSFKKRMVKAYEYVKSLPETTHVVSHSKVMRALDALDKTNGEWNDETTNLFLNLKEGGQNATQIGEQPKGNIPKYQDRNVIGQATETSGGNRLVESGQEQPTETAQPTEEIGSQPLRVGVSHESLNKLAEKIGLEPVERGQRITPEESANRGRRLLAAQPDLYQQVETDFKNGKQPNSDDISIARAHLENLAKEVQRYSGNRNSKEYKNAKAEADRWNKEVVKPMGTAASEPFTVLQGERDLDNDNFYMVARRVEDVTKQPLSKEQEQKIKQLTDENQQLKQRAEEAESKLIEATDKSIGETKETKDSKSKAAKKLADKLRKNAKLTKPGMFSAATPASLAWDAAIEIVAKSIEAGGKLADAVDAGIKYLQSTQWYQKLTDSDKSKAEKEFKDWHNDQQKESDAQESKEHDEAAKKLQEKYADKPRKNYKFSSDEAKELWDYIKTYYLNKGVKYVDALKNTSEDTGLTLLQVAEAVTTPKSKPISDEMWAQRSALSRSRARTEDYVKSQSDSKTWKFLKKISSYPKAIVTFGHGHIYAGTHYPMGFVTPSQWGIFFDSIGKMIKTAYGKEAYYQKQVESLSADKNYALAQRAGLKNNVTDTSSDDFEKTGKVFGAIGRTGTKGFLGMKWMRQMMFNQYWDRLPEEQKTSEVAKEIAYMVNIATGASNINIPAAIKEGMFSAEMESARWGRLFKNPARAVQAATRIATDLSKGKDVRPEDKVFLKLWGSRVGQQIVTMVSILGANAYLQSKINPKNPVNLTDPTKSDWLKIKAGDVDIDLSGGTLGVKSFLTSIGQYAQRDKTYQKEVTDIGGRMIGYARGKLSPLYGDIAEAGLGTDYAGNVLPFSGLKPEAGKEKLTWGQYLTSKMPIPIADALENMYSETKSNGVDRTTTDKIVDGVITSGVSFGLGVRTSPSYQKIQYFTDQDKKDPVFKYYLDKGLSLPQVSHNIPIKDKQTHTKKYLSDYPPEKQEQFDKAHKVFLKQELSNVKNKGYVYMNDYGDIEISYSQGDKQYPLSKLTKDQWAQVLSLAQKSATTKTKQKIFGTD